MFYNLDWIVCFNGLSHVWRMTSWYRKSRWSSWDSPESAKIGKKKKKYTNTGLLSTKTLRDETQRFNIKWESES